MARYRSEKTRQRDLIILEVAQLLAADGDKVTVQAVLEVANRSGNFTGGEIAAARLRLMEVGRWPAPPAPTRGDREQEKVSQAIQQEPTALSPRPEPEPVVPGQGEFIGPFAADMARIQQLRQRQRSTTPSGRPA